jgi:integrase
MASLKIRTTKSGKKRYQVQVRVRGTYLSRTFKNRREADRWAREQEDRADLSGMSPTSQATRRTVAEMIDCYEEKVLPHKAKNTQKVQGAQLDFWRAEIGALSLAKATAPVIAATKAKLAPRKSDTINAYLAVISHCFTMAVKEWRWCVTNPVRDVWRQPEAQARTRMLSDSERGVMLFYAKTVPCPFMEAIVVVALSTGMRKAELMNLTFADYDHKTGRIVLNDTKNKQRRTVALFGKARELMGLLYDSRAPEQRLFFPSPSNPHKPYNIDHSWDKVRDKVEIENFCFHDLRHSTASYLAATGSTIQDIKEVLGHKTIVTTQKYTHLTESHTAGRVQRMNSKFL